MRPHGLLSPRRKVGEDDGDPGEVHRTGGFLPAHQEFMAFFSARAQAGVDPPRVLIHGLVRGHGRQVFHRASGQHGDSYRLREKKKAGLLGRKPKPAPELEEEEEVGAEA